MSKEFEAWFEEQAEKIDIAGLGFVDKVSGRLFAEAAWEAARKDHYMIGEEVEARSAPAFGYVFARIGARTDGEGGGFITYQDDNVRRLPEWEPKEGEAVLFCNISERASVASVVSIAGSSVVIRRADGRDAEIESGCLKPFSADKIGKPWGEI